MSVKTGEKVKYQTSINVLYESTLNIQNRTCSKSYSSPEETMKPKLDSDRDDTPGSVLAHN